MGTMSPFMLKMGTVGTALIGPVLPANGASPEIGSQLDLTVGDCSAIAGCAEERNRGQTAIAPAQMVIAGNGTTICESVSLTEFSPKILRSDRAASFFFHAHQRGNSR
jgi:hypothetical protein